MILFRYLLILLVLSPAFAQSKKAMSFNEMYDVKSLSSGRISPDGQKFLYMITEYDVLNYKYINQLWIKDLYQKNLKPYKATFYDSTLSNPAWHPSNKKITYLAKDSDGKSQIFQFDLLGGKPYRLSAHKNSIKSYAWISENIIYFLSDDEQTSAIFKDRTFSRDFYFYEEDSIVSSLWEYDLSKNSYKKLTNNIDVRGYRLSPDKQSLAVIASPSSKPDDNLSVEIYLIKLSDLSVKRLTKNKINEREFGFSPDGTYITFISDANENLQTYYQDSIFKLDLETGKVTDLLPGFEFQVVDHQWDNKNGIIYFTANKGTTQQLFTLTDDKVTQLTSVNGVIKSFILYTSKKMLIFLMSDPKNPGDYFTTSINKWKINNLTEANPQLKKYALGTYKNIFGKSYDGTEIEGVVIYPYNFDPTKKYPLVVQLHGGPNSSYKLEYGFSWVTYPNVLSAKGYIVFQPNYRGSIGYSDKFMRGIIGDFFKPSYEDIISGTEFLKSMGIIDKDKMIIQGFSAGAHFTNWTITQTNIL